MVWCIEVCCSSHCTLKLFPVKPPAPRNFTTVAILETEVRLKWSPPEFHEIYQVLHYVVEFKKFGEVWEERTTANQQINTYRLTDLESETSYLFKVSAKNKQGVGISSDVITKRTLAGAVNTFLNFSFVVQAKLAGVCFNGIFKIANNIINCCESKIWTKTFNSMIIKGSKFAKLQSHMLYDTI